MNNHSSQLQTDQTNGLKSVTTDASGYAFVQGKNMNTNKRRCREWVNIFSTIDDVQFIIIFISRDTTPETDVSSRVFFILYAQFR